MPPATGWIGGRPAAFKRSSRQMGLADGVVVGLEPHTWGSWWVRYSGLMSTCTCGMNSGITVAAALAQGCCRGAQVLYSEQPESGRRTLSGMRWMDKVRFGQYCGLACAESGGRAGARCSPAARRHPAVKRGRQTPAKKKVKVNWPNPKSWLPG